MRYNYIIYSLFLFVLACKKQRIVPPVSKSKVVAAINDTIPDRGILKVYIEHDTSKIDETALVFDQKAVSLYNVQADARYFLGMGIAEISSLTADSIPCAIQTLPYKPDMSIKLVFGIRQTGTFSIGISTTSNIPEDIRVLLVDSLTKDTIDLRSKNYGFDTVPIGFGTPNSKRFKLVLK